MGVSITISAAPKFPEGTVLGAYPKRTWAGLPPQPGDPPRTALETTSSAVDAQGYARFTELLPETAYYVGAEVAGAWVWATVLTGPAGGGSGGGTTALPAGIVSSAQAPPLSASGNFTADLATYRVFPLNLTGDLTIQAPIHAPAVAATTYVEIPIITNGHKVSVPGITEWTGGEAPYGLDGTVAQLVLVLLTRDGGATFQGLSADALPPSVIPFSATPANGQLGAYNSATHKLDPYSPIVYQSKANVEALIAELALRSSGGAMAATNAPTSPTSEPNIPVAHTAGGFTWERLIRLVTGRLAVVADPAAETQLQLDSVYLIATAGRKQKMPVTGIAGTLVAIANESGGAVKLSGSFTPGSPATITTVELTEAVTVLYVADGEGVWRPLLSYRSLARLEAIITTLGAPGTPAAMGSLGSKLEQAAGYRAAGAQLEQFGNVVAIRGALKVKAGETLEAGQTLCTLPAGKRPATEEATFSSAGATFSIATTGKVTVIAGTLAAATVIPLDHVTFPIA